MDLVMDEKIRHAQYQVNYYGMLPRSAIRDAGVRKWVAVLQRLLAEKYGK